MGRGEFCYTLVMGIGRVVRNVLDLCFPWSCAVCGVGYEGDGPLCMRCDGKLAELEGEVHCEVCAAPLPMEGSPCPYCMGKGPANFYRVVRLGPYADPLRELILHLKYHRKWGIGEELAERLLRREPVKELLHETEREKGVLVAVPLHWKRHFLRWYNQAEVVARHLGRRCQIPVVRPVKRVKHTEPQTHLHSRAQREANLRDAFGLIDPKAVAGKHVVLVDDVWTTGATMQAVARVLKKAKPASISAAVLAVADPKGYERVEKSHAQESVRVAAGGVPS
jgi:ComF family protein